MSDQRARRVSAEDFERFDFIVALDRLNLETLKDRATEKAHERLYLMLQFSEGGEHADVPDPYYGGAAGFERVLDLVEEAAAGLLQHIRARLDE